jgi:hypothetical protein
MQTLLRTTSLLLALASPALAQITNGDFSAGLAGWTTSGDATTLDVAAFITNAALTASDDDLASGAYNFAGLEPLGAASLETVLGLAPDTLSPAPGDARFAFEGSAFVQSITVQAGDILRFDWTFLTNEVGGADYAFLVIGGVLTDLSSALTLAPTTTYDYSFSTGARSFESSPFTSSGSILLGLGVVDVDNFVGSSALTVDNISLAPIPEPASAATLAGLATLGLVATRRRRA